VLKIEEERPSEEKISTVPPQSQMRPRMEKQIEKGSPKGGRALFVGKRDLH